MDDEDTQAAAEHQHMQEQQQRRETEGWLWWPAYHDARLARQKAELRMLTELTRKIRNDPL